MSSPRKLGLFGVIHIDRLGKVTRELEALVGDAETIFIESPTDSMGLQEYGSLFPESMSPDGCGPERR